MVPSAHYEYEMFPPHSPNHFSARSPQGKFFCPFRPWNGWHVPDVTQGIYFSEKAESQEN